MPDQCGQALTSWTQSDGRATLQAMRRRPCAPHSCQFQQDVRSSMVSQTARPHCIRGSPEVAAGDRGRLVAAPVLDGQRVAVAFTWPSGPSRARRSCLAH